MEPNSVPELITPVTGKEPTGAAAPFRWNPTKEQINMLENLYKQGVRTPTAEQIQEVTTKLQTFGHIEGKNVFYWFQNHKARQRQKQKQDHLSYFHQYLHYQYHPHHQLPPAIFPVARLPNVSYGQCYIPQSDVGFYTQYPKVLIPNDTSTIKRRSHRTVKPKPLAGAGTLAGGNIPIKSKLVNGKGYNRQETLDLFPIHPTGILQQKEASPNNVDVYTSNACTSASSGRSQDQVYFDFFSV